MRGTRYIQEASGHGGSMSVYVEGKKCFSCPQKSEITRKKVCKFCGAYYHPSCFDRCLSKSAFKCCDRGNSQKEKNSSQAVPTTTNTMSKKKRRSKRGNRSRQ